MTEVVTDIVLVDGNKVLLVQQRKQVAYGLWSCPGGHVEAGETIEQALLREIDEELGFTLTGHTFFKIYSVPTPRGVVEVHSYTGKITGPIILKDDELMAYGWFTLESLETMRDKLRTDTVLEQARDVLAIGGTS